MGLLLEGVAHGGLQKTTWWRKCPKVGRYAALITFVGAIVGYPILLWMDPLAIFSSSLSIRTAAGAVSGVLSGFGLAFLIFLGLTSGDFWCARICPLGGTQELLASLGARLKNKWKTRSAQSPAGFSPNMPALVARRVFVVGAIGIGIGLWARKIGAGRGTGAPLRPPGAIAEDRFAGLCIRCGNCLRACPAKIVHPDGGQAGVAGLLAPMIHYDKGYCLEDCSACTQACPSGALQPLSLKQKTGYVIGEALVDMSICLLALGNKDCNACLDSCPFDAVRIHWDEEHYVAYPVIDRDKCNGCGACEVACPTDEVKAIRVWRI
jgi:ferredoxin-type protein NapF